MKLDASVCFMMMKLDASVICFIFPQEFLMFIATQLFQCREVAIVKTTIMTICREGRKPSRLTSRKEDIMTDFNEGSTVMPAFCSCSLTLFEIDQDLLSQKLCAFECLCTDINYSVGSYEYVSRCTHLSVYAQTLNM